MMPRVSGRALVLASAVALAVVSTASLSHAATLDSPEAQEPAQPAKAAEPERAAVHSGGPFGPLQIGAYAGLSFPRPLSIEGMVTYQKLVGVGVEYSVLPELTVSGVHAKLDAVDVELRVFPFRNSLFAALSVGHQRFDATGTVVLPMNLGSLPEEVTADTWFVGPRIGFLYTWPWGLSLGMDAGVQIPVASSFTSTVPMGFPGSQTVTAWQHTIGKDVLPTLDLLRAGFLF
jgi:hypothetical protein